MKTVDFSETIAASDLKGSTRYIEVKDPISSELLFLSPIRSRKGTYSLKTRHGERKDCKYVLISEYLQCK